MKKNDSAKASAILKVALRVVGAIVGALILGVMVILADAYELPSRIKEKAKAFYGRHGKHEIE